MEIRHRKQWLTGKMILQQRGFDGNLVDAREDHADLLNRLCTLISDSDTEIAVLREDNDRLCSQLSEALNKLREYREAEQPSCIHCGLKVDPKCGCSNGRARAAVIKAQSSPNKVEPNLKHGFVSGEELRESLEQFGRQCIEILKEKYKGIYQRLKIKEEFMERTGAGIGEANVRSDEELRPLLDRLKEGGGATDLADSIATAYDRQPPSGTKAETVLCQMVRKGQFTYDEICVLLECAPWMFKKPAEVRNSFINWDGSIILYNLVSFLWTPDDEAQPIPHHGPGLSEAEDAMRPDIESWVARCNRDGKQLRLIMENAPRGGIYYRLQDRFTCRNIQSGIAKDASEMLDLLEETDKARIYEVRRFGMEVE